MIGRKQKLLALGLAALLTISISACTSSSSVTPPDSTVPSSAAQNADVSADSPAASGDSGADSPAAGSADTSSGSETPKAELFGKPWATSIVSGNLPETAPEAKDDLYTHDNYEKLAEHQGSMYMGALSAQGLVGNYVVSALQDAEKTAAADGSYTDAELAQLRIFMEQAKDLGTPVPDTVK